MANDPLYAPVRQAAIWLVAIARGVIAFVRHLRHTHD